MMNEKSIEHRNWLGEQCNLPLEKLIEKPNCGMKCPDGVIGCPECKKCAENKAFWRAGEKEGRFTKAEIKMIDALWNKTDGFLRKDGCILADKMGRKFMPVVCLRHVCIGCRLSPYLKN